MEKFNFEKAVKELLAGKKIGGKDGVLAPLVKELVEAALEAEIESHIADEVLQGKRNRRNGYNRKTVKSTSGEFELATPRDREGSFEPQIVKKHQTTISDEIEEKILSMYALGMSYKDIKSPSQKKLFEIMEACGEYLGDNVMLTIQMHKYLGML